MKIKKIIFLFSLVLIIFFTMILATNSYASTNEDSNTITIKIFDKPERNLKINKSLYNNYKYVVILTGKNDNGMSTNIFLSNHEIYFDSLGGRVYITGGTYYKSFNTYGIDFLDLSNFTEDDFDYSGIPPKIPYALMSSGFLNYNCKVSCHSSADIYNYDSNGKGDLVFQAAPHKVGLIQMMSSINFLEILTEIIQILPIILVMLIGILSLRKIINLLLQIFRKV